LRGHCESGSCKAFPPGHGDGTLWLDEPLDSIFSEGWLTWQPTQDRVAGAVSSRLLACVSSIHLAVHSRGADAI